jgi:hypothetical protein
MIPLHTLITLEKQATLKEPQTTLYVSRMPWYDQRLLTIASSRLCVEPSSCPTKTCIVLLIIERKEEHVKSHGNTCGYSSRDDSYLLHVSAARAPEGAECRERLLWLSAKACEHVLEIVKHPVDGHRVEQVGFVKAHHRQSPGFFAQGQDHIKRGQRYIRCCDALLHGLKAESLG